jgi:DNA-binding transcriptional ArsR family regulator
MPATKAATVKDDICEVLCVDIRRVRRAIKALPDETTVSALAETFQVLGDPTRIKIVAALSREELCVCDLARLLRRTNSAVSHQLRLLRAQRLVKYRKDGKMAYYTLDDEHIGNLLNEGMRHVKGR